MDSQRITVRQLAYHRIVRRWHATGGCGPERIALYLDEWRIDVDLERGHRRTLGLRSVGGGRENIGSGGFRGQFGFESRSDLHLHERRRAVDDEQYHGSLGF